MQLNICFIFIVAVYYYTVQIVLFTKPADGESDLSIRAHCLLEQRDHELGHIFLECGLLILFNDTIILFHHRNTYPAYVFI